MLRSFLECNEAGRNMFFSSRRFRWFRQMFKFWRIKIWTSNLCGHLRPWARLGLPLSQMTLTHHCHFSPPDGFVTPCIRFWLSFTDYNIAQPSNRGIVSSVIESSIHAIIYYTRLNKYKVPLTTWSALTENLLFHIVGRSQVRRYPRRPTWRLYWYTTGMRTQVTAKLLSGLFGGSPDLAHKHSGISCKCRQVIFCGRPVTPFNLLCYCGHMFPHTCFLLAGIFS